MLFLKKVWVVFTRDLRVNLRDFLTLYIIVVPILFGVAIQLLAPSVNDTTVSLAVLADDDPARIEYFEQFAWVEQFPDVAAVERRLGERDNIVAILPDGDSTYILAQGDEPESIVDIARLLNSFEALGLNPDNTNVVIEDFGRTEPPLKRGLVNLAIMFIAVLGGMMIAINIVEEKMDNTVSAMNVAPLSRTAFVLGKSVIGMAVAVYGALAVLFITGYGNVNIGQAIVAIASIAVISIIIGFMQGLYATDQMDAAGSVKLLFLPLVAGVAAVELLDQSWQFVAYWIPFYWTYKGNDAILTNTATWGEILLYSGIVLLICLVAYRLLAGRIQSRLSAV